jgi:hypothetical protein
MVCQESNYRTNSNGVAGIHVKQVAMLYKAGCAQMHSFDNFAKIQDTLAHGCLTTCAKFQIIFAEEDF